MSNEALREEVKNLREELRQKRQDAAQTANDAADAVQRERLEIERDALKAELQRYEEETAVQEDVPTKPELVEEAKELGIEGAAGMRKDELAKAVEEAREAGPPGDYEPPASDAADGTTEGNG